LRIEPEQPMTLIEQIISGAEAAISINQAAKLPELHRDGRTPNVGLLYRFARRGVRGVTLETAVVGGTLTTTRPAVARFLTRLNEPKQPVAHAGPTPKQLSTASKRVHDNALAELRQAGLVA
jgi:hypothetical protein